MIGGSKGGVGKSTLCIALLDTLLFDANNERTNIDVLLIESDTSNPDVAKMYKDVTKTELIDLDHRNGWVDFVNVCDENPNSVVVVNTAARNNSGVASHGENLKISLEELNRDLITFWVVNRQRDSLELLKEYMQTFSESDIHVVRNNYFGEEQKFELYNSSAIKKNIEEKGGKSINFPEVADRISDDLFTRRLAINKAIADLPLGNRAELKRWRKDLRVMFGELMDV